MCNRFLDSTPAAKRKLVKYAIPLLVGINIALMSRNARNQMHGQFDKSDDVSAKSKRKPPRRNFGVSVCVWVIF